MNAKHRVFVENYLQSFNATDAYSHAYPKCTKETARRNGSVLLSKTDIQELIRQRLSELKMDSDEVLARLTEQARGAHGDYIDISGGVDVAQIVEDGKGYLIKKVKKTTYTSKDGEVKDYLEIEFYDAQKALELLGKYHALFTEKIDHTTKGESINLETMKPSEIAERVAALLAVTKNE